MKEIIKEGFVKELRQIREAISAEIIHMDAEQIVEFYKKKGLEITKKRKQSLHKQSPIR